MMSKKELREKRWNDDRNTHKNVESNEIVNDHKYILKKKHLSNNCTVVLETFSKDVLRFIEDNRVFASTSQNQDEGKMLGSKITQAVKVNEVITYTRTSYKDEHIVGV